MTNFILAFVMPVGHVSKLIQGRDGAAVSPGSHTRRGDDWMTPLALNPVSSSSSRIAVSSGVSPSLMRPVRSSGGSNVNEALRTEASGLTRGKL